MEETMIQQGDVFEHLYPRERPAGDRRLLVVKEVNGPHVKLASFYTMHPVAMKDTVINLHRLVDRRQGFQKLV